MLKLAILLALFFACIKCVVASEPAGNLYVLGITIDQEGSAGHWTRVGPDGGWKTTLAGAMLKDHLYTIEANGSFWQTNLDNGEWKQIGKNDFANTTRLFASGDRLYSLEKDGSLYRIDPANGSWAIVGKPGAWQRTIAGTLHNNVFFSINQSGSLLATELAAGAIKQIGKNDFANTAHLFSAGDSLYAIEKDGSLYRINSADGSWTVVGKPGDWAATLTGTILRGQLYTVEKNGALFSTNLKDGHWKKIGSNAFGATAFMFAGEDHLYTIENDGNLYRVFVRPDKGVDAYNWCAEEIEKVFRDQGKAFYRTMDSRHVAGGKVTHAAALEGMEWLRQKATPKDLAVIYIGAHGSTDPKQGWSIETADGKSLWGREVKAALAKVSCPILLFIETCTSGGFAAAHPADDPAVPPNITVLCACQASETTDNPLDIAVAEALYGRADYNHDGVIDTEELVRYVQARYKEMWPNQMAKGSNTPVIVESKLLQKTPLTRVSPQLSAVTIDKKLWSALLVQKDPEQCRIHLLGWSNKPNEPYFIAGSVPLNCICLPGVGTPVWVEQNGKRRPARLIGKNGDKLTVQCLGEDQKEDVPAGSIVYPFDGKALNGN